MNIHPRSCPFGILSKGLVAYWKLDESTGTTAKDSSGSGYDGTLTNSLNFADDGISGVLKNALNFPNAADEYVNCGNIVELSNTTSFSIAMWVRDNGVTSTFNHIFGKRPDATSDIRIMVNADNTRFDVNVRSGNVGSEAQTPVGQHAKNVWEHIAIVYDGTQVASADKLKFYFNGVQGGLDFHEGVPSSIAINTAVFKLGSGYFSGDQFWEGDIDDVRVYGYPVDQSIIDLLCKYRVYNG